jgi:hypothetical protein
MRRLLGVLVLALFSVACSPAGKGVLLGWGNAKLSDTPQLKSGQGPGILAKDTSQDVVNYYAVGSFLSMALTRAVRLEPQVLYVRQGTHVETRGIVGQETQAANLTLHYLQVPVLLRILLVNGSHVRLSAAFGTYFASLLGSELDNDRFTLTDPTTFDQGLVFETGIAVKTGAGTWSLDLRWARGLSDVSQEFDAAPQALAALVGYSFP